jgi:lincosamide nucleotidyltransferase A/C/D/E
MVTDVGDDARWNVSAADVGTVLGIAHRAGFDRVWIAGGWGVDALVGHQTRIHSDLDLAVDVTQMALDHLLQAFGRHGYGVEADWRPSRVALIADGARQVDVHPIVFDAQGTGWQANAEGQEPFRYPEDAFAQGLIDGRVLPVCVAATPIPPWLCAARTRQSRRRPAETLIGRGGTT